MGASPGFRHGSNFRWAERRKNRLIGSLPGMVLCPELGWMGGAQHAGGCSLATREMELGGLNWVACTQSQAAASGSSNQVEEERRRASRMLEKAGSSRVHAVGRCR